jgi:hypothetical protein
MNPEEGIDEPIEAFAVARDVNSQPSVSAMGKAGDPTPTPLSEARESVEPTTRKRKSRPAKKKHGTRDESKPSHPLSA